MKQPNRRYIAGVPIIEGCKLRVLLTADDQAAIARVHPHITKLYEIKRYRSGDKLVKQAMRIAVRERKLRYIRAGAGVEEDFV